MVDAVTDEWPGIVGTFTRCIGYVGFSRMQRFSFDLECPLRIGARALMPTFFFCLFHNKQMPQQSTRPRKRMEIVHIEVPYWDRRRMDRRVVKLDRVVWEKASERAWFLLGGDGKRKDYAVCGDINHPTYLHRFAWQTLHSRDEIPKNMCIDHISGDVFDCTASNLRCITYSENRMNSTKGTYA